MQAKCPACSTLLSIPDHLAGKPVKCQCGKVLNFNAPRKETGGFQKAKAVAVKLSPSINPKNNENEALESRKQPLKNDIPVSLKPPSIPPTKPKSSDSLFEEMDLPTTQHPIKHFPRTKSLDAYVKPSPESGATDSPMKNPSHLDEAFAHAAETERRNKTDIKNQHADLKIQIVVGLLVVFVGVVGFYLSYSGSKPIKQRAAANAALNKIIIAAHACNALEGNPSNPAQYLRQKYIANAQAAAQELTVILQLMPPETRKEWEEYRLKKLANAAVKNPRLFGL